MKTVAEVIGVSRSNLAERLQERPPRRIGRPPLPDEELVAQIKTVIAKLPTYGCRRVHAILKRQALAVGLKPPTHKRVYRVMKVHGLLLDRHAGGAERRHVAASRSTNVIGAGVPMASRSAATMARECGSPSHSKCRTTMSARSRDRLLPVGRL
jgi:putative transposase